MASVEVMISGVIYDKTARTSRPVLIVGEASLAGLGVGGGPIMPPEQPPGGGGPVDPGYGVNPPGDVIWGGRPGPGPGGGWVPKPPHIWGGGNEPFPTPPIFIPPNVPPGVKPPEPPQPGDPTTPVPPPEGSAGWPVQPIAIPQYIVVWYPGVGPVVVAPPAHQE